MAGGCSNWLKSDILIRYLIDNSVYISLHISDPGSMPAETEISTIGTGYFRQSIIFSQPSPGTAYNTNLIIFQEAVVDWGHITHFAIWSSQAAGNMLWYGPLDSSNYVAAGKTFKFNIGQVYCKVA